MSVIRTASFPADQLPLLVDWGGFLDSDIELAAQLVHVDPQAVSAAGVLAAEYEGFAAGSVVLIAGTRTGPKFHILDASKQNDSGTQDAAPALETPPAGRAASALGVAK